MAGLQTRQKFCHNLLLAGKGELAGKAHTGVSGINTLTPSVSCTYTPVLTPTLALDNTKELLQQMLKTYTISIQILSSTGNFILAIYQLKKTLQINSSKLEILTSIMKTRI